MFPKIRIYLGAMNPVAATTVLAFTALCFGLIPLFAKALQGYGVDSATIALYRFLFSALILSPLFPLSKGKRKQALLMVLGGASMGLGWLAYMQAVEQAAVAVVGVVYMTYPLFTIGFAWLLAGSKPSIKSVMSGLLILAGAIVVLNGATQSSLALSTLLIALASPVCMGLFIVVLTTKGNGLSPLERMSSTMTGAALVLAPIVIYREGGIFVPADWNAAGLIVGLAVVTALVPQILYSFATAKVGPSQTAIAGSLELPTMLIVGWLAFGEALGSNEAIATMLVFAAVVLVPLVKPLRPRVPTAA
ncbi:hypothetical protein E1162_00475 [Rhodobacteraceae bacterium RKSG542]|uniref:DMT family transporter n=1 Tax=Pseudovibrio flavus TaxID=2529854 RepID=UPI0012BB8F3F|nr:DMT family transporter [Pseudovibrio flavus]MTI15709.1 hypothetical protein [Pseudovibrio flavus]